MIGAVRGGIYSDDLTGLATTYSQTRDLSVRDRLAELAQLRIKRIARAMFRKIGKTIPLDDLISDGNLGLIDSMENYDPSRGIKFETYLFPRASGAMLDGIRGFDLLKRQDRRRFSAMNDFAEKFMERGLGKPTYDDYRGEWDRMDYPMDSFDYFYYGTSRVAGIMRLKQGEDIPDRRSSRGPSDILRERELSEIFEEDLLDIPERYRMFFRKRLICDCWKEAGEFILSGGLSVSEVRKRYVRVGGFFRRTREYLGLEEPPKEEVLS